MGIVIEANERFVKKTLDDLYANLAEIRVRRGIGRPVTYREIAERSGLTERTVIAVIKERTAPSPETLALLASALQVPVGDLYLDHELFARKYAKARPLAAIVAVPDTEAKGPLFPKAS